MLALIVGIIATVGWVAFDVWVSVMTAPVLPYWEWWMLILGGGALVILTAGALILEYRQQRADKKTSQEFLAGQLNRQADRLTAEMACPPNAQQF